MTIKDRLAELTRPTGEEDIMPVDYPQPRYQISLIQAAGALGIVVALCAVWVAVRTGGGAENEAETWDSQHAAEAGPSGQASGPVVVSIVGAVENPGLVTLDAGARVADALAVARPRPDADLMSLNQAQLLVDGQQIVVLVMGQAPPPGAASPAPGTGGGQGGISLNTASAAELMELPGVGEATAAAIVAYREEHGPFRTVEQLLEVKGIGPAKFDAVKDLVVL